jgi:hypothetical protein
MFIKLITLIVTPTFVVRRWIKRENYEFYYQNKAMLDKLLTE